jgi:hypothetical protein
MPCKKKTQVAGRLIPQDKEGFGSVQSHEENVIFIFEESRILRSNQLVEEALQKMFNSNNLLEFVKTANKKTNRITGLFFYSSFRRAASEALSA